ncbi:glutaredoxin family protein [Virgibacillus sp. DJP39]|uniref:glutaredoxin family protein n=1 Tax=Virgibacillus sp. DJP39 TaxID=3409790 RepID=UPI003BB60798
MSNRNVVVYTSDNCGESEKLVKKMNEWEINYREKNVSVNRDHLKELQSKGIYGTPVTFIDGSLVLGFQENKLKHDLSYQ